jgi:hypothetical protein
MKESESMNELVIDSFKKLFRLKGIYFLTFSICFLFNLQRIKKEKCTFIFLEKNTCISVLHHQDL